MKLTNLLPEQYVKSIFLGRDEYLDETLEKEFPDHQVLRMIQTHTDKFLFYDQEIKEKINGEIVYIEDLDGVFTDQKGVVLVVKAADCFPILFYHPSGIVGVVHAGRKGTENKIIEKVTKYFKEEKKLDKGWIVWLGPRICKDCYQIDRDTDEHYDLRAKNVEQIQEVLNGEHNYALDCEMCTAHQNDWFYSYRKEGSGVKMNYGLVALK
ncbi:MAG: polyphenol oxidase family protein [Candidatus Pacebacteria bacterium]|nr:polyphenol oxidase family protein [Candidatus Paceibacterota bacterium]